MRMLTLLAAYSADISRAEKGETTKEAQALLDFLIPLCKAGNTDLCLACYFRGYAGLRRLWVLLGSPVERLARDCEDSGYL